jgi:hypothetical protein
VILAYFSFMTMRRVLLLVLLLCCCGGGGCWCCYPGAADPGAADPGRRGLVAFLLGMEGTLRAFWPRHLVVTMMIDKKRHTSNAKVEQDFQTEYF